MAIITCDHLKKTYKIKTSKNTLSSIFSSEYKLVEAIKDVSFNIEEGSIVGVLGSNGAGKSTLIKMLTGILTPTEGNIQVNGFIPFKREKEFKKSIGLMMGNRSPLIYDLPVIDSLEYLKVIYDVQESYYKHTLQLLKKIDTYDLLDTPVRKLSLGQRKKMELVASILHNPKILLLDEATIGMDVQSKVIILDFITFLRKEYNTTIVYTSHDLNDVEKICDRIIYLDEGMVVYDGAVEDFGIRKGALKVRVVFSNPVDFESEFVLYSYEKKDKHTGEFYLNNSEINIFIEKLNSYSIHEVEIKKVTLEDKVLDYVDIYKKND